MTAMASGCMSCEPAPSASARGLKASVVASTAEHEGEERAGEHRERDHRDDHDRGLHRAFIGNSLTEAFPNRKLSFDFRPLALLPANEELGHHLSTPIKRGGWPCSCRSVASSD
jgi:hypothetical protein